MSTAKHDTAPAVRFENSDIRKAERDLVLVEEAQAALRNTMTDGVVGAFGTHDVMGRASAVTITKRGHVYAMGDHEDDWRELPPVPGTKARAWYDERKRIKDRIDTLRAALGRTPEDSDV